MGTEFKNGMENCGFEINRNIEDNLFAALAFIVWGSDEHSELMRTMIVNRLMTFPQKYNLTGKS